jgi:hypothetical protein
MINIDVGGYDTHTPEEGHNHVVRVKKPRGVCPKCDEVRTDTVTPTGQLSLFEVDADGTFLLPDEEQQ